jgi:GT2 family glycosyltransferase
MDLTIGIVSFNTRSMLEHCLTSASAQVDGLAHEIVVVDNASDDGSADMVASEFPGVTLIRNSENRGFAAAVNQAIRASVGRYVLLLNSDAIMVDGAAREMIDYLTLNPRVGAVGGMLLNADGTFQASFADFPTLLGEILLLSGLSRWLLPPAFPSYGEHLSHERRDVDWICGAVLMLRRAALVDIGLLDERFFMYAEEVDWCRRARSGGWSVAYLPEVRATHLVGGSYQCAPARRREQIYRSKWLYFRKNHGWLQATAYRSLVHICSLVKLLAWMLSGIGPGHLTTERARRNASSYRYLLSHF